MFAAAVAPETTPEAPPAGTSPPPPATGVSPPPAADGGSPPPPSSGSPPPPADGTNVRAPTKGFRCGGFFFAIDPNIGLWNDKLNPNWRLTFTDDNTKVKQRLPYAFAIQQRGPHVELAVRLQFGFVFSDSSFEAIPQSFDVQSGWEVTFPLPFTAIRFSQTVITPPGAAASATVYCVDTPFGISAGGQMAVSGAGVRGVPDQQTWRGEVAMVAFVLSCLWAAYQLVSLPSTWADFFEELEHFDDDPAVVMFEAMDVDRDGYISRDDMHAFVREGGLAGNANLDADALFDQMDSTRSGTVSFEQFEAFMEAAQAAEKQATAYGGVGAYGGNPMRGGNQVPQGQIAPFGGAFQPMPGGVGASSYPPFQPQPFGGAFQPGAIPPGSRPPSW